MKAKHFSDLELRLLESLRDATPHTSLLDLHRIRAAVDYGVKYDEVTDALRRWAKARNYLTLYGTDPNAPAGLVPSDEDLQKIYTPEQWETLKGVAQVIVNAGPSDLLKSMLKR